MVLIASVIVIVILMIIAISAIVLTSVRGLVFVQNSYSWQYFCYYCLL